MVAKPTVALATYKQALLQMVAYRNIRETVNDVLHRYDLNTTQWIVLGLVNDNPKQLRITDVAQALQVEGPLITILVRALIKADYIETTVSDHDARARLLTTTPAGKEFVVKAEKELTQRLKHVSKGVTPKTLSSHFSTLKAFIDNTTPLSIEIV